MKSLKKQFIAAIAMTLVAALALGSSTYAWFAANTTVSADMASISARSDAAFLEISDKSGDFHENTSVKFTASPSKSLLPVRYATSSNTWEYGYSSNPGSSAMSTSASSVATSSLGEYTWKTSVYIKAQSGSFENLTVSDVTVAMAEGQTSTSLTSAGRILAVCGDKVQLWKGTGSDRQLYGDTYLYTGSIETTSNVQVDLYFYYDGDDGNVYTNNLGGLNPISATITFNAHQR